MWIDNGGDYVTNTEFLDGEMPASPDLTGIESCWRIDPLINGGYPYIPLMLDLPRIVYHPISQRGYISIYTPRSEGGRTVYPSADEMCGLAQTNGDALLLCQSLENAHDKNSMWSISGVHPIDPEGRYRYIKIGAIIKNMGQLFTVKQVDEVWNGASGQISFYAEHVFYQLSDKFIYPYYGNSTVRKTLKGVDGEGALYYINIATSDEPREGSFSYAFTWSSDLDFGTDYWYMSVGSGCTPVEAILGSGGLIQSKGGELFRDNFRFSVNTRMEGADDAAFDIRIGKNLSGIRRVVDMSSMVSYFRAYDPWGGWFAVAWDFGAFFGDLFPHYVVRAKEYDFPPEAYDDESGWDYGEWFGTEFIDRAMADFRKNGKPIVRYEIDLDDVRNNPDFEIIRGETFRVGDKGRVWDERFGGALTMEITGVVYDGVRERCTRVIIGDRQSFVSTAMPAVDWDVVPHIVAGELPILDADGNFILDADGKIIVQEVQVNA